MFGEHLKYHYLIVSQSDSWAIEIILLLTWSKNCFLVAGTAENQDPTFKITGTKRYVHVVTLSTQDNIKLLKLLELLKEKLTGMNINLKQQTRHKTDISIF